MEKILKALLVFWGIVVGVIILKFVINIFPKDLTFLSTLSTKLYTTKEETNSLYIPMKKQYGFTLDNTKGCIKNYESSVQEKNYNYSTNGHCFNGSCSLDIIFDKQIPKKIQLYTEKNNDCILTTFEVPKKLDIMGYYVSLQLTDSQKKSLHIHPKDKVRLGNASGYSISGNTQLYFYNMQINKDNILVNDAIAGQIIFNKDTKQTNAIQENNNEVEINIPHPENLYTYICNTDLSCKKESNTYIVNVDGVDFIPSKEFILSCLGGTKTNKLCNFFTPIARTKTVQFNSQAEMNSYIKTSKNPEFNDDIQEWEIKRLNKAKQKIRSSLL